MTWQEYEIGLEVDFSIYTVGCTSHQFRGTEAPQKARAFQKQKAAVRERSGVWLVRGLIS